MVIMHNGILCTCGKRGCFEQYASANALIQQTKNALASNPDSLINDIIHGDLTKINAKTVFEASSKGDIVAECVIDKYLDYLSEGIINLINIIYPEMIVIGGGVSKEGDTIIKPLREKVNRNAFCKEIVGTKIEAAVMHNDAGIIGAAFLYKK
jgi:glucokinase